MSIMIGSIPLTEARDLAEKTAIIAAAYDAGVFEALLHESTPAGVAERAGLSRRGAEIILPVLAELGLAEPRRAEPGLAGEDPDAFTLTEMGRPLAQRGPRTAGSGLPLWLSNLRGLTRLPEVLRSGRPLEDELEAGADEGATTEDATAAREELARYMAGMAATPEERVRRVVGECLSRAPEARHVLDLGGGPGLYARAFVREGLEVTLLDRPDTIAFVREEYELGALEGLHLVEGDFMDDPLPEGPFDIVLMSNILHIYSPDDSVSLLKKVSGVTVPGSVVAIADFVRGRSPRAARFAVIMLLRTEGGNSYGEEELSSWMEASDFSDPRMVDVDDDRQLLTGIRIKPEADPQE